MKQHVRLKAERIQDLREPDAIVVVTIFPEYGMDPLGRLELALNQIGPLVTGEDAYATAVLYGTPPKEARDVVTS